MRENVGIASARSHWRAVFSMSSSSLRTDIIVVVAVEEISVARLQSRSRASERWIGYQGGAPERRIQFDFSSAYEKQGAGAGSTP